MIPRFPFALALVAMVLSGCVSVDDPKTTAEIRPLNKGNSAGSGSMYIAGYAFAPPAFYDFCKRERRLCNSTGSAKVAGLTPARLAELKSVNQSVNARIKQKLDSASTGKDDVWGLPSNAGDCEDFAILKKHELMKRGWPSSALLLTVVTYMGQGHVLLTVRTDQGDMVLDNRTNSVKAWSRTPYRFFARQSQSKYGKWDKIGA